MSRGPDAATLLSRAIVAHAAAAGVVARVINASATRWASATFVGARHRLTMVVERGGGAWLDGLAEADLPLRRHLVADLIVTCREDAGDRIRAVVEALTVEDG